ncbi:DUF4956 domain-containing protein [Clostridium sp. SHJSY1]|uniref:DUF4956 domain-containing protein n=1 Tax=Clostridium sp. SHJSY1 TaxID=2942483 RepID=UPI002875ECA2|nr:DUF4956 domain-containing protein [Clostridium sp. SHJSY1]MDS0525435.1 DUF4956 domain-containing protein [Clostridium sp. SHJSY1]
MKEQLFNYLNGSTKALTINDILINFLIAVILGMVIYISYRLSHSGAVYSARFNVSLVMLTLITALVMNVIGNNISLSLGMVGALSVVRFRTAIKDPRDTAYVFWAIAVGICCGVSDYMVAGIGSVVIFFFLLIFGAVQSNEKYLLIVRGTSGNEIEIEQVVRTYYKEKAVLRVKNTSKNSVEFIYELSAKLIKKAESNVESITEKMYKLDGINNVNIVCQNDEINR